MRKLMIDFEKIDQLAEAKLRIAERHGHTITAARYRSEGMLLKSLENLTEEIDVNDNLKGIQ